jgi:cell division transport system ATP-binding protein
VAPAARRRRTVAVGRASQVALVRGARTPAAQTGLLTSAGALRRTLLNLFRSKFAAWASMIRFEGVTKTYKGDVVALRDVSFDISKGEFVFVVGPSGSGKSTALRLLLREENSTSGRIIVAGRDISRLSSWKIPQLRRNVGCVFQDYKLLPNKTVYENVAFAQEVIGRPRHVIDAQVPQILDLVGLSRKTTRFPTELSGGEQQRVSIARAFVNRPLILLADEPTGNVDPATTVGIMRLLDRINRTGTTIVMATHDQRIVDAMRRRVIELDHGTMVRDQARGVYGVGS